jgi:DNA-binding NarL/FixJ family response regulator
MTRPSIRNYLGPDSLNGIEAIIGIRSEFPHARIIVFTSYGGDVQTFHALKAGARVTY